MPLPALIDTLDQYSAEYTGRPTRGDRHAILVPTYGIETWLRCSVA